MAGMTGAGKSLMTNNIINYIYGVSYKDGFRLKLVTEDEEIEERGPGASRSMAQSMTSWISCYHLNYQDGFRINYSLAIIDTPGFGDTRGIRHDQQVAKNLQEFLGDVSMPCLLYTSPSPRD